MGDIYLPDDSEEEEESDSEGDQNPLRYRERGTIGEQLGNKLQRV
jgi:hypothetical protein